MPESNQHAAPKPHLSPQFCSQFRGVCAECPHAAGRRRSPRLVPDCNCHLPPQAELAIDALARCRKLTSREREVLILCCCGLKNRAIATHLKISPSAIRRHMRNLHRKSRTEDKAELILNLWHSCADPSGSHPLRSMAAPSAIPPKRPRKSRRSG